MRGNVNPVRGRAATRFLSIVACAAFVSVASGATALAETPDAIRADAPPAYSMELRALTGPQGADVTIGITALPGYAQIETIKKVQLKIFAADGSLDDVRNLTDVTATDGATTIPLGTVDRGQRIEADVLLENGRPSRVYVVRGDTRARLRPDLVIETLTAPAQTLTTRPVDVRARIAE